MNIHSNLCILVAPLRNLDGRLVSETMRYRPSPEETQPLITPANSVSNIPAAAKADDLSKMVKAGKWIGQTTGTVALTGVVMLGVQAGAEAVQNARAAKLALEEQVSSTLVSQNICVNFIHPETNFSLLTWCSGRSRIDSQHQ